VSDILHRPSSRVGGGDGEKDHHNAAAEAMNRPATAGSQRPVIAQPAPDSAPAANSNGNAQ
jgi:hypothetical protein